MKLAADLHIHSCMSPCGDSDMTPNNIVGMAKLKGLDAIAVTDHNGADNLPSIQALCDAMDIMLLPGIEVQSVEEVHLLCYLPTVELALELSNLLYAHLPDIPNNERIFGHQWIMNDDDMVTGEKDKLLISSVDMDIDEIFHQTLSRGGACVPAHINRPANSLLGILGFIPLSPQFSAMEVCQSLSSPQVRLDDYHILYSSDAHYLGDIFERQSFIEVSDRTPQAFIDKLNTPKKGQ